MSKLQYLALSGAFALTAALATQGHAQVRPADQRPATARGDGLTVSPTLATPGRVQVLPIRPHVDPDPNEHLRRRLHNACFNSPNPPPQLCRRVYGRN